MEGGSIDVNGRGALMTTEQCLLNPNRNPGLSREAIEGYFREYLGISRVIWLRGGIAGDDTDGHVDDVARFAGDTTVLCAVEKDPGDKNHAVLAENFRILTSAGDQGGKPLHVVPLPMPGRCGGRNRVPASYANFYIGNGVVLVPVFDDPADNRALEVIGRAFPDRKIIGIDCRAMVEGMGAIHCISQQLPAP
jgi:agmatine deiminase